MKGAPLAPDRGTFPSKGSQPTKRVTIRGGALQLALGLTHHGGTETLRKPFLNFH